MTESVAPDASHLTEETEGATNKPTLTQALKHFNFIDQIRQLPRTPCARTSLLNGMATAAAVGTIQVLFGRGASMHIASFNIAGIMRSMNWAVGSFMVVSIFGW